MDKAEVLTTIVFEFEKVVNSSSKFCHSKHSIQKLPYVGITVIYKKISHLKHNNLAKQFFVSVEKIKNFSLILSLQTSYFHANSHLSSNAHHH